MTCYNHGLDVVQDNEMYQVIHVLVGLSNLGRTEFISSPEPFTIFSVNTLAHNTFPARHLNINDISERELHPLVLSSRHFRGNV